MSTAIGSPDSQKVTVTLPKYVLERLDEIVPRRRRSQFITQAIEDHLVRLEQIEAVEESAGMWTEENFPHLRTEADIDQWLARLRRGWERNPEEND
jgi:predicted transcriptional regulator